MRPPAFLAPALTVLADNLDVLPAVGGAVEELVAPGVCERDGAPINAETREVIEPPKEPCLSPRDLHRLQRSVSAGHRDTSVATPSTSAHVPTTHPPALSLIAPFPLNWLGLGPASRHGRSGTSSPYEALRYPVGRQENHLADEEIKGQACVP